jgi:hypothetical protein
MYQPCTALGCIMQHIRQGEGRVGSAKHLRKTNKIKDCSFSTGIELYGVLHPPQQ